MWIRVRLDIGWIDLMTAIAFCVQPGKRSAAIQQANQAWSPRDDFLVTLSVRSAFDLLLRALKFPPGSEIIFSALTVPDMVRIARSHGLIPVPADVDQQGTICPDSLRSCLTPQTRMIVVAHLFGGQTLLDDILKIAREHQLLVVEDCAQSFQQAGEQGHEASDIAMFSFGPIKTATALGGAVVRISSPELCSRMKSILQTDPVQPCRSFAKRVIRFAVLKALTGRRAAAMFKSGCRWFGLDFDGLANASARGFTGSDFRSQIRRQPSTALLRLLARRWKKYDYNRIDRRKQLGRSLDERIGNQHPPVHSYWVYPIFVTEKSGLCERLSSAGFDATGLSRMTVVSPTEPANIPVGAQNHWDKVLFLPWYPELTDDALEKMSAIIAGHKRLVEPGNDQPVKQIDTGSPTENLARG